MKTSGSDAQDESFRIWGDDTILYTSPPFASSTTVTLNQCLPTTTNNQYRLQMLDSQGNSWSYDSVLQIEGVYGNIVFKYYMSTNQEEYFPLSLYNPIPTNAEWKFLRLLAIIGTRTLSMTLSGLRFPCTRKFHLPVPLSTIACHSVELRRWRHTKFVLITAMVSWLM